MIGYLICGLIVLVAYETYRAREADHARREEDASYD